MELKRGAFYAENAPLDKLLRLVGEKNKRVSEFGIVVFFAWIRLVAFRPVTLVGFEDWMPADCECLVVWEVVFVVVAVDEDGCVSAVFLFDLVEFVDEFVDGHVDSPVEVNNYFMWTLTV